VWGIQNLIHKLFFLDKEKLCSPTTEGDAKKEIDKILQSKLWRFTRPLRVLRVIQTAIRSSN
jgi:hypothetical protein